ncbi:MAG: BrnT family toxin [Hyphomicrobiaceae bacterium]
MRDDEFEWDDRKSAANLARHRVSFDAARVAFDDSYAIALDDHGGGYGEDRYILVGMVRERLLAVAFTLRGDRIRIISARVAEPFERRMYHEKNRQG